MKMKKTIFSIMFAMILGSFTVSCGNNAGNETLGTGVDSTLVDSTVTVAVDTFGVVDAQDTLVAVVDSVCAE